MTQRAAEAAGARSPGSAASARLLDAAIDHSGRNGIGDTSLRGIAEAVGTSHRMLIYHFGSREGLLAEVTREPRAGLERLVTGAPCVGRLEARALEPAGGQQGRLRGVVLLTDGQHNPGPPSAAGEAEPPEALAEKLGDRVGLAMSYRLKGVVVLKTGKAKEAIPWFQRSIDEFERLGSNPGLAMALADLVAARIQIGDTKDVRAPAERALALFTTLGDGRGQAAVLSHLLRSHVAPEMAERWLQQLLEIATRLARDIAEPDTRQLGEVFLSIDDDGDGVADRFSNRVATPHLWEGALVYLTAMAYYEPARFGWQDDVLPDVTVPDVPLPSDDDAGMPDGGATPDAGPGPVPHTAGGGCGCRAAGL